LIFSCEICHYEIEQKVGVINIKTKKVKLSFFQLVFFSFAIMVMAWGTVAFSTHTDATKTLGAQQTKD